MSDIVGLALRDDRIDCVVVRRRLGRARILDAWSLKVGEEVAATLRAKLRELGVRTRRVHVGIPRRLAVVKAIELPAVAGADLRRMVGFELERHLPFAAADAIFDFHVLDQAEGQPVRVLLVAVERRVFERVQQLLRDAGLVPRLIDVTIHRLARLAAQDLGAQSLEGRAVVHVEDAEAELAIVRGGRPILSRAFPLPPDVNERGQTLAKELRRSLEALPPNDRDAVADVTVTGPAELPPTDWAQLPVQTGVTLPAGVDAGPGASAFAPALAMALPERRRRAPGTNLVPDQLRPRPFPWPIAATAALAAAALLLALAAPAVTAIREERRLAALDRAVARIAPDVHQVEQVASAVERARREVETLRAFQAEHLRVLPVLRELTERLPTEVWLSNLSLGREEVELAGFAASASELIPLLEASPTFDLVEFTSPVTRGRDREQFRLKAKWERPAAAAPPPAPAGSPARTPAAPGPSPRPPRKS